MPKTNFNWLLRMAWRDSRKNWGRLLLFISSIVVGIAALVGINSFGDNLQKDINGEAKTLLGADLQLETAQPITDSIALFIDSLGGTQARTTNFASMAYFPKSGGTRLAYINALEGDFPFYGKLLTEPESAAQSFRNDGRKALVDRTLMIQFDLEEGDSVKVGNITFVIEGTLLSMPGRNGISASVAPLVLIPMSALEATGLIQKGSRIEYSFFFKYDDNRDVEALVDDIRPRLRAASMRDETVQERKEEIGEAFSNLTGFLNLVSFVALLLGCIGVASAVHIYIKDKVNTVAVLRCIGASGRQAFLIYLIQIGAMGLAGAALGALAGSLLQVWLPIVFGEFLPVNGVSTDLSWASVGIGIVTGLGISLLFALLPLLGIRKVSPLRTLRASFEEPESQKDPLRWFVYLLIFLFILGFTVFQTGIVKEALFFPLGIGLGFLILVGVARLIMWAVKRFFPTRWSYIWRQSLANLYRPNNQTLILMVSIGLGTALISTLFLTRDLLLNDLEFSASEDRPNMVLFDIQTPQKAEVAQLTSTFDLPLLQQVPIVTTRLTEIDGYTKSMALQDSIDVFPLWVYNREFRVTYRDTLIDSETIVDGEWHADKPDDTNIYVSVADWIADDLDLEIGSKLTFNVQGALVETVVSSTRAIDFKRIQTNFTFVFPSGVLEKAPQFHVIVSRTKDQEQSALFQQALVKAFPNVSVIDLSLVLRTVDDVLGKVSFVIQFMALFSILTGLLVLISSVILSRYQRIKESVLLRTIGASRKQIQQINAIEYFLLGTLATFTGLLLSVGSSWALAVFWFKIPYYPAVLPLLATFVIITGLIILIGMLNNREVVRKPPLEVLRREV